MIDHKTWQWHACRPTIKNKFSEAEWLGPPPPSPTTAHPCRVAQFGWGGPPSEVAVALVMNRNSFFLLELQRDVGTWPFHRGGREGGRQAGIVFALPAKHQAPCTIDIHWVWCGVSPQVDKLQARLLSGRRWPAAFIVMMGKLQLQLYLHLHGGACTRQDIANSEFVPKT